MQVALIAPNSMLEWTDYGDMHFIIPETADVNFYSRQKKYKIFDNGAYESSAMDAEAFMDLAKKLKADEIIIPDVLFDETESFKRIGDFYSCYDCGKMNAMIVPQAENPAKWVDAYQLFTRAYSADVIGVPKWLDGKFHCRAAILNYLAHKGWLKDLPHHLLGVDSLTDLLCIQPEVWKHIRSCDTSKPFTYAYAGQALTLWHEWNLPRVSFNAYPLKGEGPQNLLQRNIMTLLEVAHWKDST